MDWIKEINYKKHLTGDLEQLEEIIGIDNLLKIIETFGKTTIYISEKPILEMKKEYIIKNYGKMNERELARKLKLSERLVYKIGSQKMIYTGQQELFKEEQE